MKTELFAPVGIRLAQALGILPALSQSGRAETNNSFDDSGQDEVPVTSLAEGIGKVFIIAYKESTQFLEETLALEGLQCEVLRQEHQPEFRGFSPSYLCLLNHCEAWERASQSAKLTLIVEADFVPVIGLGRLPLPCDTHQENLGVSWLYLCAPQVYSVSQEGYADGFSVAMVAYIVTPRSARCLMDHAENIKQKFGPSYSTWDSDVDGFLRERNFKNYISFRNYGEHGGRPNPEHRQNKLSPSHRADILYGKLAFLPMYAIDEGGNNSYLKYIQVRLQARLKGIARLLAGRFVRLKTLRNSRFPIRLLLFALRRHLSLSL
jgi:hypothetical protein